jgi:D-methionine transport system ATP-binding protein
MKGKHCVRIVFSENSSFEPVIGNMVLAFKTPVNILYANTKNLDGVAKGEMILQLPEDENVGEKMIAYLKSAKLAVEVLEDYVG